MKKLTLIATGAIVALSLLYSCSGINENRHMELTEGEKFVFGKIDDAGKSDPILLKDFAEINGFIQTYNLLAKVNHTYFYENAWIEVLHNLDKSVDYFLAVGGVEKDPNNKPTGSCYTVYMQLSVEANTGNLFFAPPGSGHTCTGHCCSSCDLKPHDETHPAPWCDCVTPTQTPSCENETRCDHSVAM